MATVLLFAYFTGDLPNSPNGHLSLFALPIMDASLGCLSICKQINLSIETFVGHLRETAVAPVARSQKSPSARAREASPLGDANDKR